MQYDLVFEGGGAKGIVFVGAMQEFEKRGHKTGRLLGTSAGAITATLLAVGYSAAEMGEALDERINNQHIFSTFLGAPGKFTASDITKSEFADWLRVNDVPLVPEFIEEAIDQKLLTGLLNSELFRHIFSLVERGGWYEADAFVDWMSRRLDSGSIGNRKRDFSEVTLAQLFERSGVELSLVASNTTAQQILVLNHNTTPNLPVVWAVRMSMSIPLLWQEVAWRSEWGGYRGKDVTGHIIVDGGLLSNFPIELFISRDKHVTDIMGEQRLGNQLIGLLIDDLISVPQLPPPPTMVATSALTQLRTIQRIERLIGTATSAHDKMVIDSFTPLVARMPSRGIGTTEFEMSAGRRSALIDGGRNAMSRYLDGRPIPPPGVAQATIFNPADLNRADTIARNIFSE